MSDLEIISTIWKVVRVFAGLFVGGLGIGVGVAFGMEAVMRLSGSGRTVILTMARTRFVENRDE